MGETVSKLITKIVDKNFVENVALSPFRQAHSSSADSASYRVKFSTHAIGRTYDGANHLNVL